MSDCPKCLGQGGYVLYPENIGNPEKPPVFVTCACSRDFWKQAINNNRVAIGLPPQTDQEDEK